MSISLVDNKSYFAFLMVVILRYFIIASFAYIIFYVLKKEAWKVKKIQPKFPGQKDYLREIFYSILTAFIFAAIGSLVFLTSFKTYTRVHFKKTHFW